MFDRFTPVFYGFNLAWNKLRYKKKIIGRIGFSVTGFVKLCHNRALKISAFSWETKGPRHRHYEIGISSPSFTSYPFITMSISDKQY